MSSRMDKLAVLEHFELALQQDKAKPQIGQLSDLGLVELTRHRQGQSLAEVFTKKCDKCNGSGFLVEEFKLSASNTLGEMKAKMNKIKGPFNQGNGNNNQKPNKFNKNKKAPGRPKQEPAIEVLEKVLAPILEEPIHDAPAIEKAEVQGVIKEEKSNKKPSRRAKKSMKKEEATKEKVEIKPESIENKDNKEVEKSAPKRTTPKRDGKKTEVAKNEETV